MQVVANLDAGLYVRVILADKGVLVNVQLHLAKAFVTILVEVIVTRLPVVLAFVKAVVVLLVVLTVMTLVLETVVLPV